MNIEQKTANAILHEVNKLDCRSHLPFPEAEGEYHHGYYQAVKDVLDIVHKFASSTTYHANSVSKYSNIIDTPKGRWCQDCQEFAGICSHN